MGDVLQASVWYPFNDYPRLEQTHACMLKPAAIENISKRLSERNRLYHSIFQILADSRCGKCCKPEFDIPLKVKPGKTGVCVYARTGSRGKYLTGPFES